MYIWETGYRLVVRFREHRRDVIKRRNNLSEPAHFNEAANHILEDMKDAALRAGLAKQ